MEIIIKNIIPTIANVARTKVSDLLISVKQFTILIFAIGSITTIVNLYTIINVIIFITGTIVTRKSDNNPNIPTAFFITIEHPTTVSIVSDKNPPTIGIIASCRILQHAYLLHLNL